MHTYIHLQAFLLCTTHNHFTKHQVNILSWGVSVIVVIFINALLFTNLLTNAFSSLYYMDRPVNPEVELPGYLLHVDFYVDSLPPSTKPSPQPPPPPPHESPTHIYSIFYLSEHQPTCEAWSEW